MKTIVEWVRPRFCAFVVLTAMAALYFPITTFSKEETSAKPVVEQSGQPDAVPDDDSASEAIESAKEATSAAIETAKQAISEAIDRAKRKASSALEAEKGTTKEALDKAQEATRLLDQATEATREVLDKAQEATEEVLDKAKEAVQEGDHANDGSSASTDSKQAE